MSEVDDPASGLSSGPDPVPAPSPGGPGLEAAPRLPADFTDPEAWLCQAQLLAERGDAASALEACRRALALWPDITPVYRLQFELARGHDPELALRALRGLVMASPNDADLNSELGATLCRAGDFVAALPFLRAAVPSLGHANDTLWNYTSALAITANYGELLGSEALLDRLAAEGPSPYPPYAHLAVAKLAQAVDRKAVVAAASALRASPRWLDPDAVSQRLADAIATATPFSLVRLDIALSRFVCFVSRHANRVLRPPELSAMLDSVWQGWFGAQAEDLGVVGLSGLERAFNDGLRSADVTGLPEPERLQDEPYHFGFLAEMQRACAGNADTAFTAVHVLDILHERVPYLRPLLSGLPFLGVVGAYPGLFEKLGRFCGIAEMRTILVPRDASMPVPVDGMDPAGFLPQGYLPVLEQISVPAPGAVFLVSAPGPLGVICCGRIKAQGGIAIDIGPLAHRWAGWTPA